MVQYLEKEHLGEHKDKQNSYHVRETKEKAFQEESNGWCHMPPTEQGECALKSEGTGLAAVR